MKNFILTFGRFIIDVGAFIQFLLVIALSIFAGIAGASVNEATAILCGIVAFIVLTIIFVMSNYLFYLFVGIHDAQESMAKSLKIIANGSNQNICSSIQEDNSLRCPNCRTKYNEGDKFCEECGTKLN